MDSRGTAPGTGIITDTFAPQNQNGISLRRLNSRISLTHIYWYFFYLLCYIKMIRVGWKHFYYDLPGLAPHADGYKTINKRAFQGPTVHKWPWVTAELTSVGICEIIKSHCHWKQTVNNVFVQKRTFLTQIMCCSANKAELVTPWEKHKS